LFKKASTVSEWANEPEAVARAITERYQPKLQSPRATLAPSRTPAVASRALMPYFAADAVWDAGEEYIINEDEEILAVFDNSSGADEQVSNLVLTNLKLVTCSAEPKQVCTGFDLFALRSVQIKGHDRDRLQIDSKFFQFIPMNPVDTRARVLFGQMVAEIARGLMQADRAAREAARRAWKSGDGPARGAGFATSQPERPKPRLKPDAVTLASIDVEELTDLESTGDRTLLPNQADRKRGGMLKRLFRVKK
jgi:hypothetical protein